MAGLIIQRKFSSSTQMKNMFSHITVIGGGLMGSGIAQVIAQSGMDVTVVEVSKEAIKRSSTNIKNSLQRVANKLHQNNATEAEKYIADTMARLKMSTNLKEVVGTTDLVIEAIIENMSLKHKLFTKLDVIAPQHTIFTSNTSSLSITEIASITERQDRFAGLHFFNPVPVMKLLEVIRTKNTSDETFQKLLAWGKAIGKTCISCKDTPGFVVNRLLIPYLAEAIRMLERGDASAKDIDIAMKLGAGYPMGPLELLDYVGLDTTKFILDGWHEKNPDHPLFKPIALLEKLVSEGKMGRKTGEGFYSYKIGNLIKPDQSSIMKPAIVAAVSTSSATAEKIKPDNPLDQMLKPVRKIKPEKVEKVQTFEESVQDYSEVKLKKFARFGSLEKWKNADEFIKFKRESKAPGGFRKPSGRRLTKQIENYVSRDIFKCSEKFKNFQEFIRFERERNLRPFNV